MPKTNLLEEVEIKRDLKGVLNLDLLKPEKDTIKEQMKSILDYIMGLGYDKIINMGISGDERHLAKPKNSQLNTDPVAKFAGLPPASIGIPDKYLEKKRADRKFINFKEKFPLELKRIKEILDFNIIEKKDISKIERYKDINKPYYGEIEYIYIKNQNGTSTKYHTSSLLIFETGIIGNRKEIKNETHLSFYTGLFDALQVNYNVIWSTGQSAFASFLKVLKIGDANELDKIKKDGLSKYQRKKEMQIDSSTLAVIGSKDTLEVLSIAGKTDFESLQKVIINDIATRLGIPVSKLMGASAGALASAEQDGERYKEVVEQYQRVIVKDFLKKVLDMLMATLEIYEPKYEITFNSIAAKDIKKEAEVGKIQAERDKIKAEATKTSIETLITLNKELNDDSIANTLKRLADKLKDSLILDLELEDE